MKIQNIDTDREYCEIGIPPKITNAREYEVMHFFNVTMESCDLHLLRSTP